MWCVNSWPTSKKLTRTQSMYFHVQIVYLLRVFNKRIFGTKDFQLCNPDFDFFRVEFDDHKFNRIRIERISLFNLYVNEIN